MNRPEKLASAMGFALRGLKLDQRMREGKAMALWPDIVGGVTAERTKPLYVNRGTMTVLVSSSAWANQLNLLKPKILAALSERCGPGVNKDIRWRTGDQPPDADAPPGVLGSALRIRKKARDEGPALSEAETAAIAAQVRAISDPELAKHFERTLTAQARRRARLKLVGWVPCKRCGVLHDEGDRPFIRAPRQAVLGSSAPAVPAGDRLAEARLCPVCRMALNAILE
jgi:hypothetical protein